MNPGCPLSVSQEWLASDIVNRILDISNLLSKALTFSRMSDVPLSKKEVWERLESWRECFDLTWNLLLNDTLLDIWWLVDLEHLPFFGSVVWTKQRYLDPFLAFPAPPISLVLTWLTELYPVAPWGSMDPCPERPTPSRISCILQQRRSPCFLRSIPSLSGPCKSGFANAKSSLYEGLRRFRVHFLLSPTSS